MSVIFSASSASEPIIRFPLTTVVLVAAKRSYLLGGLQLHISVRFYLAFHDLIGIFAGISVIGCHPEGSFVIPVRYRFRIRYDCCRSCVLEFHFGVVQRYRIGNGYCYCIVRNVGRVRFPSTVITTDVMKFSSASSGIISSFLSHAPKRTRIGAWEENKFSYL